MIPSSKRGGGEPYNDVSHVEKKASFFKVSDLTSVKRKGNIHSHKREEVMLEIIYQNHALRSVGWGSEVIFGARLAKTLPVRPLPSTDLCPVGGSPVFSCFRNY